MRNIRYEYKVINKIDKVRNSLEFIKMIMFFIKLVILDGDIVIFTIMLLFKIFFVVNFLLRLGIRFICYYIVIGLFFGYRRNMFLIFFFKSVRKKNSLKSFVFLV